MRKYDVMLKFSKNRAKQKCFWALKQFLANLFHNGTKSASMSMPDVKHWFLVVRDAEIRKCFNAFATQKLNQAR